MINTIQEGVVFNLADKVEFKESGFRPLVIDSNDKAEHVLMAVDAGVLIPDHQAPADLIFQALEGGGSSGGRHRPSGEEGDFLFMKKGTLHHLQAVTKFKFSMVRIY